MTNGTRLQKHGYLYEFFSWCENVAGRGGLMIFCSRIWIVIAFQSAFTDVIQQKIINPPLHK